LGSAAHFSRTFRKHFGLTAKEFREIEKAVFAKDGLYFSKNGQLTHKIDQLDKNMPKEILIRCNLCLCI